MKITFIGHASILVETHGVRILSDPWWRGPCFGAQWWNYPKPHVEAIGEGIDFIYISHGHHDHLHPGTLRTLSRATCLVSRNIGIADTLRGLGFPVVELGDDSSHELAPGVRCRIIETYTADTLFAVEDGERVCVNLNDSLHAAPTAIQDRFVALLKSYYPQIDYLFCGYGVASHFPNCYVIPGKNPAATAATRQAHFNRQWARLVGALSPVFAFPFAADVALLEKDLIWVNEPTANSERPTDVVRADPAPSTAVFDIAPGFSVDGTTVVRNISREPTSLAKIHAECAKEIERANCYGSASRETFDEVLKLVTDNVALCLPYLRELTGDYRFLIQFRSLATGICIVKRGRHVEVVAVADPDPGEFDVVYVTRLHYVRWSLTTEHGHEILFVGSGGIFHYRRASDAKRNLHRELVTVLRPHESCPPSRFGDSSRLMYAAKRFAKTLLGFKELDLYDLAKWTVWQDSKT